MNIKKITALFLTLFVVFSLVSVPASATDNNVMSEDEMDSALRSRGYPQIALDAMSIPAKRSLYDNPSLQFNGGIIMSYDEESGSFTETSLPTNGIMLIGQIPTSDLSLLWTVHTCTDDESLIYVRYDYIWHNLPMSRFQDPVAISWDDDLFNLKTGSFHKVDYYDTFVYDGNGNPVPDVGNIHSEESGYASASEAGVTWYADLKGYGVLTPTALYGYGEFALEKKNLYSAGSSLLYGHYVHAKVSGSLGIDILGYGNIDLTGVGTYDERGNQLPFNY